MKKLLIISNNVLSNTNNNGKTLLSFVKGIKGIQIAQLYFSGEVPMIYDYKYFRISDKNIIKGLFNRNRGAAVYPSSRISLQQEVNHIKSIVGRNEFSLVARELLWLGKSRSLLMWLDDFHPDSIIFLAGDSIFAYSICEFIMSRYNSKLNLYITDDYIMPRTKENIIHYFRRKIIIKKLSKAIQSSSSFFTISDLMRNVYKKRFGKDSNIIANFSEDYYDRSYIKKENEIIFAYTGSFYYKRSDVLGRIAQSIKNYNSKSKGKKAKLMLYSNENPDLSIRKQIIVPGASEYGGSLSKGELIERLNTSDVLVFVESFDQSEIEKVKYSLSTKVSEYLSVGKPILAVGPKNVSSINYLKDVSICAFNEDDILATVSEIIDNYNIRLESGAKARKKYMLSHNKNTLQKDFVSKLSL